MDVREVIRTKRATRVFADRPVPEEAVRRILNAGRRAESSKNSQPWHFVAIRARDTLRKLSECGPYAGHLAGAALAVAVASPEPATRWIAFDLGQAVAYMQLAAWELGIGSCIAAIYEPDKARRILGVPEGLSLEVAVSFGYAEPDQRRRGLMQVGRRPFDDVVHWESW